MFKVLLLRNFTSFSHHNPDLAFTYDPKPKTLHSLIFAQTYSYQASCCFYYVPLWHTLPVVVDDRGGES
jgi:hypothetical protein